MINPRVSADWSTTKPIATFSCTPRVPEVHTKDEVVHLTPALLTAVSRNTISRHLDTPPKNFRPPWLRIATVFPVFFYTYYHVAYALYCDVR